MASPPSVNLPVAEVFPALRAALADRGVAVLEAPPGAGKTTLVPLALLDEPWLAGRGIVMLEPRRLAARAAARRMAALLGEAVGERVGYRMRMESAVGPRTRVTVVTEGMLVRAVQSDPALERVGLVILDEAHERSLQADLSLALLLQVRELLRPDLRLLAMSATLDGAALAQLMDDAPVVRSEGRTFPVETRYLSSAPGGTIERTVAAAVRDTVHSQAGDILAFLPGAPEIRRVLRLLDEQPPESPVPVDILPLYGDLPGAEQDRAIAPSPPGRRKVVLTTAIAETSLTIDGVRTVIDAGRARVPRFDPRGGMSRLETLPVSRDAADQRRGRAGRLGPGLCLRLWTHADHATLPERRPPEIRHADLAPLALDLAAWGAADPVELRWLDPPNPGSYSRARELLGELGALDGGGRITPHGRTMAALGAHPRVAHLLLRGAASGAGRVACALAALLGERDILRTAGGAVPADLHLRLDPLLSGGGEGEVESAALRAARERMRHWRQRLRAEIGSGEGRVGDDAGSVGLLVALAYPDRIAVARGGGRFLLRNGRTARLGADDVLARAGWLAVAELSGTSGEARIALAAPITLEEIEREFAGQIERSEEIVWDEGGESVLARAVWRLGALVLRERPLEHPGSERVAALLLDRIRQRGLLVLPWSRGARSFLDRVRFLHHIDPEHWPDLSDGVLLDTLDLWLGDAVHGVQRLADLDRLDLEPRLASLLDWSQRAQLDALAPAHITVPSGSRLPLDYTNPEAPVLAVRLQEMFGASETPRVAGGRVPLLLHLLSPAGRPMQLTRDLPGFWRGSYADVRREMRGRYPKHHWPDDPLAAQPTARARRRGE